jgi:hypothetical protein
VSRAYSPSAADHCAWLAVRDYLGANRQALTAQLASGYSRDFRVAETNLIGHPDWLTRMPYTLTDMTLSWNPDQPYVGVTGAEPEASTILPNGNNGKQVKSYSQAIQLLRPPKIFSDKSTYRLRSAELSKSPGRLTFSRGSYFDGINVGEACAHEYAAYKLGLLKTQSFRNMIDDPLDFSRRPVNMALSCLTLRRNSKTGQASFPLHWRDPAKVAHAGGLTQVIPVGIFQAINSDPQSESSDFSLWRCLLREYAEELLGRDEFYGTTGQTFDYSQWTFAQQMEEARRVDSLRVSVLGLGVDPLTLATDLLIACVIEDQVYDEIFGQTVSTNEEGKLLGNVAEGQVQLWPFTEEVVNSAVSGGKMQAAGAALLRLAWQNRASLIA